MKVVVIKIAGHGMPQWARINEISIGQTDPGSVICIGCHNQFVRCAQTTGRGEPVIRPHARDTVRLLKRIGCFGGAPINACFLRTECCDCVSTKCVALKVRFHGIALDLGRAVDCEDPIFCFWPICFVLRFFDFKPRQARALSSAARQHDGQKEDWHEALCNKAAAPQIGC